MKPEELQELLGPDLNLPYDRIVRICERFNLEAKRAALELLMEQRVEGPCEGCSEFEPGDGIPTWAKLRERLRQEWS